MLSRYLTIATLSLLVACTDEISVVEEVVAADSRTVPEDIVQVNPVQDVPKRAKPYAHYCLLANNPSRECALTEQESAWDMFAQSPYAKGLRQFTDSTGKWLAQSHCSHLGSFQPFNPDWSMRCGIIYSELLQKNNNFGSYCLNRKIAEAEYNGGAWIVWEMQFSNNNLVKAEQICGKVLLNNGRKRAKWACKENYGYFVHISRRQPKYESLGGTFCP